MADQHPQPSHLDITFSVGTSLLVIAPLSFDVDPARRDSGVVYCGVTFNSPMCKGAVGDVFIPEQFHDLAAALARMMKGEAASLSVSGLECWFRLEGAWNPAEQVAAFKASMPEPLGPGDWCLWHKPSNYRGSMKTCVELEFWMEPAALEEPLAELEAILEHIKVLRGAFPAQGDDPDVDEGR